MDSFTTSHLVSSPLCSERVSNQHTASHHKEVGSYRGKHKYEEMVRRKERNNMYMLSSFNHA